jgi:hypothetical protein
MNIPPMALGHDAVSPLRHMAEGRRTRSTPGGKPTAPARSRNGNSNPRRASPSCFFSFDTGLDVVWASTRPCGISSGIRRRRTAVGKSGWFLRRVHPDDRDRVAAGPGDGPGEGGVVRRAVPVAAPGRPGGARAAPGLAVRDRGPPPGGRIAGLEGVFVDISERVRLEALLVQNEKLKTLGVISAELVHEIRNPLMAVAGFAAAAGQDRPCPGTGNHPLRVGPAGAAVAAHHRLPQAGPLQHVPLRDQRPAGRLRRPALSGDAGARGVVRTGPGPGPAAGHGRRRGSRPGLRHAFPHRLAGRGAARGDPGPDAPFGRGGPGGIPLRRAGGRRAQSGDPVPALRGGRAGRGAALVLPDAAKHGRQPVLRRGVGDAVFTVAMPLKPDAPRPDAAVRRPGGPIGLVFETGLPFLSRKAFEDLFGAWSGRPKAWAGLLCCSWNGERRGAGR